MSGSTRERIISAAEALLDEAGIGNVNVADTADAAGIHRVTVYRYFPDRNAIWEEILERRPEPVLRHAADRLAKGKRFLDDRAYAMAPAIDEPRRIPGLLNVMAFVQDGGSLRTQAMSDRCAPISRSTTL